MISIKRIENRQDLKKAQEIRHTVFVIGQHVPVEDEIDTFENQSYHYLAFINNNPAGAARWRYTDKGIKLERFAVLKEYRGSGIGSALVEKVLHDIRQNPESKGKTIYLHSQLEAIPLYRKYGFRKQGDLFEESGIMHYEMILG